MDVTLVSVITVVAVVGMVGKACFFVFVEHVLPRCVGEK